MVPREINASQVKTCQLNTQLKSNAVPEFGRENLCGARVRQPIDTMGFS
jgi:hypothetical protein